MVPALPRAWSPPFPGHGPRLSRAWSPPFPLPTKPSRLRQAAWSRSVRRGEEDGARRDGHQILQTAEGGGRWRSGASRARAAGREAAALKPRKGPCIPCAPPPDESRCGRPRRGGVVAPPLRVASPRERERGRGRPRRGGVVAPPLRVASPRERERSRTPSPWRDALRSRVGRRAPLRPAERDAVAGRSPKPCRTEAVPRRAPGLQSAGRAPLSEGTSLPPPCPAWTAPTLPTS